MENIQLVKFNGHKKGGYKSLINILEGGKYKVYLVHSYETFNQIEEVNKNNLEQIKLLINMLPDVYYIEDDRVIHIFDVINYDELDYWHKI